MIPIREEGSLVVMAKTPITKIEVMTFMKMVILVELSTGAIM